MRNYLLNLKDIDISSGVEADLFISCFTPSLRSKHIPQIQSSKQHIHWQLLGNEAGDTLPDDVDTIYLFVDQIHPRLTSWLSAAKVEASTIYIDISSMPHSAMATILETIITYVEKSGKIVELICGYVLAEFIQPPGTLPPNEDICPVSPFFAGWPNHASATTSLIIGLGYEREKAEGACEYFDASDAWLFTPKSPITAYDDEVYLNNKSLIERLSRKNRMLGYNICAPAATFGELVGLVLDTSSKFNIVILPFGPKIFYMLSLITAAIYQEVGIWNVTGTPEEIESNQTPSLFSTGFSAKLGPPAAANT